MSLSYSALTNHGKVTLGSVDSWGTNMSILKDPPKSLYTRRIDKVGQTSDITASIDEGSDRACESILQYARGVNPSVSVSYNNTQSMNGQALQSNNQQAYLPYRVNREGAFRPPIQTEYNLKPLSRMPRVWTSSFSNPSFIDFSKGMLTCNTAEKTKEVKSNILKVSARPTAVYKIDTPQEKPYEVKYMVKNQLQKSAQANINTTDRTVQNVLEPTKEINRDIMHAFANSNIQDIKYVNNNQFNPDRYIQDSNSYNVDTNMGAHYMQPGYLDDFVDMNDIKVKNAVNIDYVTPLRGNNKTEYIHGDLFQERNLPYYETESNKRGNEKVTYIHDDLELSRTLPVHFADTNMRGNDKVEYIHGDIEKSRNIPEYNVDSNMRGNDKITYIHDDVELNRNMPYYSTESNIRGDKKYEYMHDNIELERNIPEYNIDSTMRGNEKVSYIHDDIQLDRVLPEYELNTMKSQQNIQKRINPEYIKKMNNNVPAVKDIYINKEGRGESNISSRNFQLADKIQPGGYQIPGQIPNQNRVSNIKENFETDKSRMGKKIIDQHMNRFGSPAPFGQNFSRK